MGRGSGTDGGITPLTFQILVALAGEALHGYGIIKDIEERNGPGSVTSTGAMYLALQRMEDAGWVEEADAPDDAEDARRRYYRLTEAGRLVAVQETARLAELVGTAHSRRLITSRALGKAMPGGGHGR